MIGLIDNLIGRFLRYWLHKKHDSEIENAENTYLVTHEVTTAGKKKLHDALTIEVDRVYEIANSSIIRARILQARYTFWYTAVILVGVTVGINNYLIPLNWAAFFIPFISAFVGWGATIITIPANFNERVTGGLNSALLLYDRTQQQQVQQSLSMRVIMGRMPLMQVVEEMEHKIDIQRLEIEELKQQVLLQSAGRVEVVNDTVIEMEEVETQEQTAPRYGAFNAYL